MSNYASCQTIVGGVTNTICGGGHGIIGAGRQNTIASGHNAAGIVTGCCNTLAGSYGTLGNFIGSGCKNSISGAYPSINSLNFIGTGIQNCIFSQTNSGYGCTTVCLSTIVAGRCNKIDSGFATFIGAGQLNTASATYSTILGGERNLISSVTGSCAGNNLIGVGYCNRICGCTHANIIVGGTCNVISGSISGSNVYASGGCDNFIGGGLSNMIHVRNINGKFNFIGSGYCNRILEQAYGGFIGGGFNNLIWGRALTCKNFSTSFNTITGGDCNKIVDYFGGAGCNTIGGGHSNCICQCCGGTASSWEKGIYNSIGGGSFNYILTKKCHRANTIGGGRSNRICYNDGATIAGGYYNNIFLACTSVQYINTNTIGGGCNNQIKCSGEKNVIGGGGSNILCNARKSGIFGGFANCIICTSGVVCNNFILGGSQNKICNGFNNVILGGCSNCMCGQYNLAHGRGNCISQTSACFNLAFGCDIQIGCGDINTCFNAVFGCDNNICCCGKFNIVAGDSNTIGAGSTSNDGQYNAVFGQSNKTCACYNLMAGLSNSICSSHLYSAILGTYSKTSTQCNTTFMCNVCAFGSLSKASGTFTIDHPNPCKTATHNLHHSFVESPTAGDNLYRFEVEIGEDLQGEIILPEYYRYLNENSQVWVNPVDNLGRAFGIVNLSATKVKITASDPGKYNVLVVGTRKDKAAVEAWKGVETLKNAGELENYKNSKK